MVRPTCRLKRRSNDWRPSPTALAIDGTDRAPPAWSAMQPGNLRRNRRTEHDVNDRNVRLPRRSEAIGRDTPDYSVESSPLGELDLGIITEVKEVSSNLKKHFPEYDGQGHEIAGFCWHQGWNDGCNEEWAKEYARNMPIFIRDVREDLGVANLPFVIANSGFGGRKSHGGVVGRLQKMVQPAQAAAAKTMDNVQCVETRDFYRPQDESPGRGDIEHWYSNAESYFLIGDGMGKAMKKMLSAVKK